MAQSLSVLRGSPNETSEQVGQRLTRQSDAWANPLNQALSRVSTLESRWRGVLDKAPSTNLEGGTMYYNSTDSKVYVYVDEKTKWLALN